MRYVHAQTRLAIVGCVVEMPRYDDATIDLNYTLSSDSVGSYTSS